MKAEISVMVIIVLVFAASSSISAPAYIPRFEDFAILIHDVSPGYFEQLREITALIDTYSLQNATYLFVIPNHGGGMPLEDYPAFVAFLGRLKAEGYHVELHGYAHTGDEFDCNASTAEKKLELGLRVLSCLNVTPEYFIAPRYSLSEDALAVLLSRNITVIGEDFVYFPNGTVEPVYNREYTWYLPSPFLDYQLASARASYAHTGGTFLLSLHPKAVNNDAGMEFLREFLGFLKTCEKRNPLNGLG
ncbi:DUF2334 domain-containing protein [Thermococcus indicus]|uniref:DUF2334 domain-containing protein n=1 Tax=Thermococcus indicus TaxID=2586643 RepID=A0A4Y5SLZ2_9EURY|nr:DUF2334 domain-containing protein [Thermococcus indicus]QDA30980.1 DUF2334 domain-containing protein [Thermococcus indicus]